VALGLEAIARVDPGHTTFGGGYPETFEAMRFDEPVTFGDWYEDWLRATESLLADGGRDLRL